MRRPILSISGPFARLGLGLALAGALALGLAVRVAGGAAGQPYPTLEDWGRALFFDANLSLNRSQSCATCHDPAVAFTDPRQTAAGRAVSLGDNGSALGDRNAPSVLYAALAPEFGQAPGGEWRGGQFHDGRAADLAAQAAGPFLNPDEMAMPDEAAVLARLQEDPDHAATLAARLGPQASDPAAAYAAITGAIAAFEASPAFLAFDSKYDRWLRGEAELSEEEELGRVLFFSAQFTNCHLCHQLQPMRANEREPFSNYRFRNIGTPANLAVRELNGSEPGRVDLGLFGARPEVGEAHAGAFKVPSLRNVAVTGPYMHNGVFADLDTVIRFYNTFNSRSPAARINPETGRDWGPAEVPGTVALKELEQGPALDDQRIAALVAFLKTLTDARYEALLDD